MRVLASALLAAWWLNAAAAPEHEAVKSSVDDDGTLHVLNESIPYSDLASPQARRSYIEFMRRQEHLFEEVSTINEIRARLDTGLMIPQLERLRKVFAVSIAPAMLDGVQTDIVEPRGGIAPANQNRVLINLHGGGMKLGGRYGGQLESVPIARLGAIKIITVDYRLAPEFRYPAASEDVAKVYRELLKSYRPENIGLYGCSAGAWLTANAVAWFQTHGLPRPGAIGLFGWGAIIDRAGDSNYLFTAGKAAYPKDSTEKDGYLTGMEWTDPRVSPVLSAAVLSQFPPSLLISGTRDIGLSPVVYTHSRLVDLGVKADLHVWEGAPHCSYAQPVVDPDVPENRQAWSVITRFFDEQLGKKAK